MTRVVQKRFAPVPPQKQYFTDSKESTKVAKTKRGQFLIAGIINKGYE
jgi:hypothetical protein